MAVTSTWYSWQIQSWSASTCVVKHLRYAKLIAVIFKVDHEIILGMSSGEH